MNSAPTSPAPATSAPATSAPAARNRGPRSPREVKATAPHLEKAVNDFRSELGRLASKHGLSFDYTGKTGRGEDARLKAETDTLKRVPEKDRNRILELAGVVSAYRSLLAKIAKASGH